MSSIDIILVLDASGSMHPLIQDTVGGVNHFLEEQRTAPGDGYVTLVTFDEGYQQRYAAQPLRDVSALTPVLYYEGHGGSTALLDAVGKAISAYEQLPLKADKVMFVIVTDGEENASYEWPLERVRDLIKTHQDQGWAFIFLGANDSQWQGMRLGTRTAGAYTATPKGVQKMYTKLTENTKRMRGSRRTAADEAQSLGWDTSDTED